MSGKVLQFPEKPVPLSFKVEYDDGTLEIGVPNGYGGFLNTDDLRVMEPEMAEAYINDFESQLRSLCNEPPKA